MTVYLLFGAVDDFTDVIGVFAHKVNAELEMEQFAADEYDKTGTASQFWIEKREVM